MPLNEYKRGMLNNSIRDDDREDKSPKDEVYTSIRLITIIYRQTGIRYKEKPLMAK